MEESKANKFSKGMSCWTQKDTQTLSNYTVWQVGMIESYIGKSVLEFGAGEGRIVSELIKKKKFVRYTAIEPAKQFFDQLKRKKLEIEALNMTINQLDSSFENRFDTVISSHVLEHIEDDLSFLKDVDRFLMPGGKLVFMVPAHQFLMSNLDRNIGHYRRYNKRMIVSLAKQIGYSISRLRYDNFVGLFGWFWFCKIRKIHYQQPGKKNKLVKIFSFFDKYFVPVASYIEKFIAPPIGLNLTFILQKK
jgi:SAM-dependent methyltransferase